MRQAAAWRRNGLPLRVAVNVSPACLGPALVETVRRLLDHHRLPAHLLQLEITEHGAQDAAADFERSADSLNRFHELGMSMPSTTSEPASPRWRAWSRFRWT